MEPFTPNTLPLESIEWTALIEAIGAANLELGNLKGTLKGIVNPGVLLSPLTLREAVLSSRIEGTQATLQEVLFYEAMPDESNPKRFDIQEVINYRKTLNEGEKAIKDRPMNLNMLKDLHAVLMDSVRGQEQRPGEFRRDQNWIGPRGSRIEQAYFIPPDPKNMQWSLQNWEHYWHHNEKDPLVQMALLHAQFEIIHPFRDGNGRIGRVLIPLFLTEKGILENPTFYFSEYLESNRDEYYSRLRAISDSGDWNGWIQFFLAGVRVQARAMHRKAEAIILLYEDMKRRIFELNSTFGLPALDTIFTMPIFSSREFVRYSGIPRASAQRLLVELRERDILKIVSEGVGRRPTTYSFPALLEITESPLELHS